MTTKKDVIIKKYLEFQSEVKEHVDTSIFPDLDEMDLMDLLIYFNLGFGGVNVNYERVIRDTIKLEGVEIDEESIQKIIPIAIKFIKWLLNFQRQN